MSSHRTSVAACKFNCLGRKILTSALLLISLFLSACSPKIRFEPGVIPQIGEPTPEQRQIGQQAKEGILSEFPILREARYEKRVSTIVGRLLKVTPAAGHWSVYVVDGPVWNAATAPGNIIIIFRELLDDLKNDDEVAAVLAHELSHRLAVHEEESTEEKWGKGLSILAAIAAGVAVAANENSTEQDVAIAMGTVGALGAGFTTLKYSKTKEQEADQIGLFLMADAGFNPQAAARVWYNQMQKNAGRSSSDFFSTHPLDGDRYQFLTNLMPLAEQRYRSALIRSEEGEPPPSKPVYVNAAATEALSQASQLLESSDYSAALSQAQTLVNRYPSFPGAFNLLGMVQVKLGDTLNAARSFARGLKMAPNDADLLYNNACVAALSGKDEEALAKLKSAFRHNQMLITHAKEDSDLFSLHDDPRFDALLKEAALQAPARGAARSTFSVNR